MSGEEWIKIETKRLRCNNCGSTLVVYRVKLGKYRCLRCGALLEKPVVEKGDEIYVATSSL